jgi:micrococcal nuclease
MTTSRRAIARTIGLATLMLTLTACRPLTRSASSEATPSATARARVHPASAVASSRTHRDGAASPPGSHSGPDGEGAVPGAPAVVVSTVDGDTVHVRYRGRLLDVRLIGVDTPETVDPSQPVQCFGEAASRFTARRLSGHPIHLEFDVERRDRYGRTLAYVWIGDRLFNRRLVAGGYATVSTYPPDMRYVALFEAAQRAARAAHRGLWRACAAGHGSGRRCDPAYPGVCIPSPPPDLNCADVRFHDFRVLPPDPQNFDGDRNGRGCET